MEEMLSLLQKDHMNIAWIPLYYRRLDRRSC